MSSMIAPPAKPPKQRRPTAVLVSLAIALILVVMASAAIFFFVVPHSTAPATTSWKTLTGFHGTGLLQKTSVVTVPRPWKLLWTCTPQDLHGAHVDSSLIVNVYHQTGKVAETAVSTTCQGKRLVTRGEVVIQSGGHLYFNVLSQSNWTLTVQIPG